MKQLIPIVVVTMLTMGCGGDSDSTTPATDTTQTDTATADTATTDIAVEDTATPPTDTASPDVTLPPPPDVTLPPPDVAANDAAADTTVAPVTSCRGALECSFACKGDGDCIKTCTGGVEVETGLQELPNVADDVFDVLGCQTDKCNSNNDIPCVLDKCYEPFSACFFAGKSGDAETGADCKDTKSCVEESCSDEACVDTCLQSATTQAQKDYVKLYFCVQDFCASNSNLSAEDCKKQGELSVCSSQWGFCFDF